MLRVRIGRLCWISVISSTIVLLIVSAIIHTGSGKHWIDHTGYDDVAHYYYHPQPKTSVIGPVDAVRGIPGVLEMGMPKSDVVRHLGKPSVYGLSAEEAREIGEIDPEDVSADCFDSVAAWVNYGNGNTVMSVKFDMKGHSKTLKLIFKGNTYVLDNSLSKEDVIRLFRQQSAGSDLRVQGGEIVLLGSGTSLNFDIHNRLAAVWVINYISR